jgi:hypothetical protein
MKFSQYIIKRFIVEAKHFILLNHGDTVTANLQEFTKKYRSVDILNNAYLFSALESYCRIYTSSDRILFLAENITDFEELYNHFIKKDFLTLPKKFGIDEFQRIGVRTYFLLPVENLEFKDLVDFTKRNFFSNITLFEKFGKINDTGIVTLTIHSENYKINLNLGPFHKEEVRQKISEFKNFDRDPSTSLLIDLDLYDVNIRTDLGIFIKNAFNEARINLLQFKDELEKLS